VRVVRAVRSRPPARRRAAEDSTSTMMPVQSLDRSAGRRPRRSTLKAAVLLLGLGCTTYQPLAGTTPRRDSRVRISLTDSGAVALARYLGPQVVSVTGRMQGDSSGAYVVAVSSVQMADGTEHYWHGDVVQVPRPLVANVRSARTAPLQTALLTGLIVGAAAGIFSLVRGATSSGLPGSGSEPGPR
jgi:hypothetical protein